MINHESNTPTLKPKLLGLPRPLAGAICGVLLVVTIGLFFWKAGWSNLAMAFLYPSALLEIAGIRKIFPSFGHDPSTTYLIASGISLIPPAIIGSMIVSSNEKTKKTGSIFLWIYIILWMVAAFFFGSIAT